MGLLMTDQKTRLWCQANDCDETIDDDDDVVWVNYQQGECYHRECYAGPERNPRSFSAGELVMYEELPENAMSSSGKPENVGYDLFAVINDGVCIEMKMAYEVTAVYEHSADEPVGTVLSGEPRSGVDG